MADEVIERSRTGILGYDAMSHGGFVKNSSNVVVGGPGSGKSTFLLEFLYNGVTKYNENGLYCSFEPDILDTLNDTYAHGWDFFRLAEEGRIKFIKFSPDTSIDELKNELTRLISQHDIRRICFDPVSVLALNVENEGKVRERVFDLVSLMKRLKVTSLLADESLDDEGSGNVREGEWTKTDIIRFLCDSVTVLYTAGLSGDADRSIRIEKMRRTDHDRKIVGMKITDKGIDVLAENIREQLEIEKAWEEQQARAAQQAQLEAQQQSGQMQQGQPMQQQDQSSQSQMSVNQQQMQQPVQ